MARTIRKSQIRKSYKRHPGVVTDFDVRVKPRSKLFCRVIVFTSATRMRVFFGTVLETVDIGIPRGVCSDLTMPGERHTADPRCFAVIGLVKEHLTVEVVVHECVHAAMAYARRVPGDPWRVHPRDRDEENVCYPSGVLSEQVMAGLLDAGLWGTD